MQVLRVQKSCFDELTVIASLNLSRFSTILLQQIKVFFFDNGEDSFTWKYYNWKDFLSQFFTALPGISKYHSFRFNAEHPGFVFVKENINSQEMKIQIVKLFGLQHIQDNSPTEIAPAGMSRERSEYLFRKIRPFVRPTCQDLLCPPTQTEE